LLFVPAAKFLQTLLNSAKAQGLLTLPVDLPHNHDFPILWFADDTLIFMPGDTRKLLFLPKEILIGEAHGYNTRFSNGNKKQLSGRLGIVVFVIFRANRTIT
jgi:hypothetical protein